MLWFEGNKREKIPPYRYLLFDDVSIKKQKKKLSELRCIVHHMHEALKKEKVSEDLTKCKTNELLQHGERAAALLPRRPKKHKTRTSEWLVSTALREVRQTCPVAGKRSRTPTRNNQEKE